MFSWVYVCKICAITTDDYYCKDCKQIQRHISVNGVEEVLKILNKAYSKEPLVRIHTRSITNKANNPYYKGSNPY